MASGKMADTASSSSDQDDSSVTSGSSPGRLDIVEQYSDIDDAPQEKLAKHGAGESGAQVGSSAVSSNSSSSSSDDETEDEEGEQMTADVDAAILSTLAKIRRKDESIYDAGKRVFDEEQKTASSSKLFPRILPRATSGKSKVTLSSYQRERMRELIETSDDPGRALADATMGRNRQNGYDQHRAEYGTGAQRPYAEQQDQLRRDAIEAFHATTGGGSDDEEDDDEDDDNFLQRKNNGAPDGATSDGGNDYKKYLLDVLGGKEDEIRDLLTSQVEGQGDQSGQSRETALGQKAEGKHKSATGEARKGQDDEEDFLVNYVLNRGWLDDPSAAPKGPAYTSNLHGDDAKSEDSFDSRADAYETAYNFRFQELEEGETNPQIQSYARQIEGSVRRKEEKRKREREERAKRKQKEKEEKRQRLDLLRDAKRKSIVDKLKALREATGSSAVDFEDFDLEGDFDPAEHDRLMAEAFNDAYYGEDDDQKPSWSDDGSELGEVIDDQGDPEAEQIEGQGNTSKGKTSKKSKQNMKQDMSGEDRVEMDADFIESGEEGRPDNSGKKLTKAEKKKLKKRERAKAKKAEKAGHGLGEANSHADGVDEMDMDAETAAEVDKLKGLAPEERKRKMDGMMDEYYGLDYEDMIGDQPTRFKYTQVPKSDFGMTAEEILMADDTDLNKIISLKRLQPYRRGRAKPSDLNMRLKEFRRNTERKRNKGEDGAKREQDRQQKRPGKRERERKARAKEASAVQDPTQASAMLHPSEGSAKGATSAAEEQSKHKTKRVKDRQAAVEPAHKKHKKQKK